MNDITDQQAHHILLAMNEAVENNRALDDAPIERMSGFAVEFVVNEVAKLNESSKPDSARHTETLERELRIARTLLEKFRTRLGESNSQIGDCTLSGETDFFLQHCKPDQESVESKYQFLEFDDHVSYGDDTMHTATINILEKSEVHWSAIEVHGTSKEQAVARRDYVLRALQSQVGVHHVGSMPPSDDEMKAAAYELSKWLSAALDDRSVCAEYKNAINAWFDTAMPVLVQSQAQQPAQEPYGWHVHVSKDMLKLLGMEGKALLLFDEKDVDKWANFGCKATAVYAVSPAQEPVKRLQAAIEGELNGLAVDESTASKILAYVQQPAQEPGLPDISALNRIAKELKTYIPEADEYKGKFIHKVWAKEIESALKPVKEVD